MAIKYRNVSKAKAFLAIDWEDTEASKFLKEMKLVLHSLDLPIEESLLSLGEEVKLLIEHKFPQDSWGQFMKPRTKVQIIPMTRKVKILIGGYTEGEARHNPDYQAPKSFDGTPRENQERYNLWAVQEFGYRFKAVDYGSNKKIVIPKDAGGVVAGGQGWKTISGRKAFTVVKNAGRVNSLVQSLRVQILELVRTRISRAVGDFIESESLKRGVKVKRGYRKQLNQSAPAGSKLRKPKTVKLGP